MSGRNRRFRRREEQGEDDADDGGLGQPQAAAIASLKAKQKEKKAVKKTAILSFQDEEGVSPVKAEERPSVFKANAPAAKPLKQKARPDLSGLSIGNSTDTKATTQQSAAGEYSIEKLRELRANAKSFQGPKSASQGPQGSFGKEKKDKEKESGGFKLSGSFKPAGAVTDDRFEATPSQAAQNRMTGSKPVANSGPGSAMPSDGSTMMSNQAAASMLRQGKPPKAPKSDDARQHVPSAEMIRLAKQKRERLRSAHLAPDYVPLGGASGLADLESRLNPEGGLRAERDSESGSDNEDPDRRMQFIGRNRNRIDDQSTGLFSNSREQQGHAMEDEDEEDWVKEQIRKGVSSMATMNQAAPPPPRPDQHSAYLYSHNNIASMPVQSEATLATIALKGKNALDKLRQDFQRLQLSRENIRKQATKTEENARNSVNAISELEEQIEAAGQKYVTLQKIKAYIADLCDMLQAKSAIVEEMQEHLFEAGKHRAAVYAQRCREDEAAENEVATASVSAALNILSRGGDSTEARQSAASAAKHAEHSLSKAMPAQLDEFGRDISLEGGGLESERQARLTRRNQKMKGQEDECGGEATTDESDTEERQYERERDRVKETASHVFSDADKAFSSLKDVRDQLEDWRRTYPEAYNTAHAPLSVPALFAPFVRNELLLWDPIFTDSKDFDRQKWHTTLQDYGQGSSYGDDDLIVPKLVMNLVCPILLHAVQVCWNPFSRTQTKRLVKIVDLLLVYTSVEDHQIQELYKEITVRLEESIQMVKLPPWPAAALSASQEALAFQAHRFGKAVRLTANIGAFDKFLPRVTLQEMVFDRLLQQQIATYVVGDALDRAVQVKRLSRLASAIPSAWFKETPPRSARALLDCTKHLAAYYEGRKSKSRATVKELAALLKRLGQADLVPALERN